MRNATDGIVICQRRHTRFIFRLFHPGELTDCLLDCGKWWPYANRSWQGDSGVSMQTFRIHGWKLRPSDVLSFLLIISRRNGRATVTEKRYARCVLLRWWRIGWVFSDFSHFNPRRSEQKYFQGHALQEQTYILKVNQLWIGWLRGDSIPLLCLWKTLLIC